MKYCIFFAVITVTGIVSSCHQQKKTVTKKEGIVVPDHIIIVIEENHGYDQLVGSPNAPYINQLAGAGAVFTDSHGVTHPSQGNYLAFFSGSTLGVTDDHWLQEETPFTTPNLGAALIQKGYSFKGFAQSMPSPGFPGCNYLKSALTGGTIYARKHVPWVNWQGNKENNFPDSLSQPMTAFPKDFNQLPTVAIVIPDQDYDMHNIGDPGDAAAIKRGDDWLKENIGTYVEWAKTHNSLLILTFDEDESSTTENHILTFFSGPMVKPGKYGERIDHYSVLNTIEALYDLPASGTTNALVIKDIWKK